MHHHPAPESVISDLCTHKTVQSWMESALLWSSSQYAILSTKPLEHPRVNRGGLLFLEQWRRWCAVLSPRVALHWSGAAGFQDPTCLSGIGVFHVCCAEKSKMPLCRWLISRIHLEMIVKHPNCYGGNKCGFWGGDMIILHIIGMSVS